MVLIGIDRYNNGGVQDLRGSVEDVIQVENYLKESGGVYPSRVLNRSPQSTVLILEGVIGVETEYTSG